MNDDCSTGKRRFPNPDAAKQRLRQILDNPDPSRLYHPSGVVRCGKCGGYHLTSKAGKVWASGKQPRDRRRR